MTSFRMALQSLLHERGRVAVSVVGTAFAVVLIFMQLGFLGATGSTATILYDQLNFDILLTSRDYIDFGRAGSFDRLALAQAAAAKGVNDVESITIDQGLWTNPAEVDEDPQQGKRRWAIIMLGLDPNKMDKIFRQDRMVPIFGDAEEMQKDRVRLGQTNTVLMDVKSKEFFGGANIPIGTKTEYNSRRVQFGGYFTIGTGFSYTGLLMANEETAGALNPRPTNKVTFGLVTVKPDEDVAEVAARIRKHIPTELPVRVYTREQIRQQEKDHWLTKTPVGKFFNFGVILALIVGAIFVYQMMVADIKKRLPEYATLKAMGYRFMYLFWVVVWQSLFLAVGGYVVGLLVSLVLYQLAQSQLPVEMTLERLIGVFMLATAMCVGSALVAVKKVRSADPADLF